MGKYKKRRRNKESRVNAPIRKEKKKLTGPIIFALLTIGVMAFSVVGFIHGGSTSGQVNLEYNDFDFSTDSQNNWISEINNKEYLFYNHPLNVEDIFMDNQANTLLKTSKSLTLTSDLNSTSAEAIGLIGYDIKTIMQDNGVFTDYAFTTANDFGKTVVNCDELEVSVPVIYFKLENSTSITYKNGCVIAQATSHTNLVRLRDRILFTMLGVME